MNQIDVMKQALETIGFLSSLYTDGTDPTLTVPMDILRQAIEQAEAVQAQDRKPLTDEQVFTLIHTKHFDPKYHLLPSDEVCLNWYRLGIRDGEAAHGIKGAKHDYDMARTSRASKNGGGNARRD